MVLLERIKLSLLVNGNGIADNYKNNTMFFGKAYQGSSNEVTSIPVGKIQMGGFYFLQYKDDSNWMKYSPVFTVALKRFNNMFILLAVNFNFIPIEVRATIYDEFITETNFEKDKLLSVDFEGMYNALLKYGFEYAIVEYNLPQIVTVHKIKMDILPRFLYAGHPVNKYDPEKLYSIWKVKLQDKDKRHQEMMNSNIADFYSASDDIKENYTMLKDHIDRLQRSVNKYGNR